MQIACRLSAPCQVVLDGVTQTSGLAIENAGTTVGIKHKADFFNWIKNTNGIES